MQSNIATRVFALIPALCFAVVFGQSVGKPSGTSSATPAPSAASPAAAAPFAKPFTDSRDGKAYKTVVIGTQTWMAENLNFATSGGSWCYGDDNSNCDKYGRLYDWETAKKACPAGWHLPSREEWQTLAKAAGGTGDYGDGGTAGKALKSTSGWNKKDNRSSGNGTDEYGFSVLPGGGRSSGGSFYYVGNIGLWWTATERDSGDVHNRYVGYGNDGVHEGYCDVGDGMSVRCLRD